MFLEVCSSTHNFTRRNCWQLSSLLQQQGGHEIGAITADIAGTSNPGTTAVAECFRDYGLPVQVIDYEDKSRFQFRGYVRNDMIQRTTAKWVLFADADMVFPPGWVSALATYEDDYPDACCFTGRYSTTLKATEEMMALEVYPSLIENSWTKAGSLPAVAKQNLGAGFCHLVRGEFIRKRGFYVPEGQSKDWPWSRHSKCQSDVQFRRSLGGYKTNLPWLVHLQHHRDKEFGEHISTPR